MQHPLKFTTKEKINIWLDLCEFTFKLLRSTLSKNKLRKRLKRIRQIHLQEDYLILSHLARIR